MLFFIGNVGTDTDGDMSGNTSTDVGVATDVDSGATQMLLQ